MGQSQTTLYRHKPPVKRMTKTDLLLLALLLLAGSAGIWFVRARAREGAEVRITVDGQLYGTYPLSKEAQVAISLDGPVTNTLLISGGSARMVQADCPDKLCVQHNAVSKQGETIVCLPNKIVVEVTGGKAAFDSVAR